MSGWDKHPRYGGGKIPWLFIACAIGGLTALIALMNSV